MACLGENQKFSMEVQWEHLHMDTGTIIISTLSDDSWNDVVRKLSSLSWTGGEKGKKALIWNKVSILHLVDQRLLG